MLLELVLGAGMLFICVILQATASVLLIEFHRDRAVRLRAHYTRARAIVHVGAVVVGLLAVHFLQMYLWIGAYLGLEAFADLRRATFYSFSTFTTLGFANYQPAAGWEIFATIEGAAGMLTMGWSAGIVLAVATQLFAIVTAATPQHRAAA
jgi:voltage-gated potassium channel